MVLFAEVCLLMFDVTKERKGTKGDLEEQL